MPASTSALSGAYPVARQAPFQSVSSVMAAMYQEPGFRMPKHGMLLSQSDNDADMEFAVMSADRNNPTNGAKPVGVSVFRPGQVLQT